MSISLRSTQNLSTVRGRVMNSTHNSETPVLKRKRVEPVDGAALLETNDVTAELQPTRDDQFYLENQEANCVIRAGDILFKVSDRACYLPAGYSFMLLGSSFHTGERFFSFSRYVQKDPHWLGRRGLQ